MRPSWTMTYTYVELSYLGCVRLNTGTVEQGSPYIILFATLLNFTVNCTNVDSGINVSPQPFTTTR